MRDLELSLCADICFCYPDNNGSYMYFKVSDFCLSSTLKFLVDSFMFNILELRELMKVYIDFS